jgi:hypothetical protein
MSEAPGGRCFERCAGAWLLLLVATGRMLGAEAIAQEGDEAALALADRTRAEAAAPRTCIEYSEVAAIETTESDGAAPSTGGRGSFAIRCDAALGPEWRAVVSDRFDDFFASGASNQPVNTLKEAYLSFRGSTELFDFGRINVRQGVGYAYNPTDYFRADALRAVISIDPDTLRDERLGTLMARSQTLWSSGSLTAVFAPRVSAQPNDSPLNPDFGATNDRSRWLVVLSQRVATDFQPQLLVTGAQHSSPQVGLDLTHLLNSATVAYLEYSGGRSPSNLALSEYEPSVSGPAVLGLPVSEPAISEPSISTQTAFRPRLSTGLAYTTPYKLSVTLEYEYDAAAPGSTGWRVLRTGPIPPYVQYRDYAALQGELATRQNLFVYAHWDDVLINRLGLTAFVRYDPYDHSRVTWAEARYHWEHLGWAIQWQRNAGDATSDEAPWPVRQSWLALIDYYF